MNPETTLSSEQITSIFRHHELAQDPKIRRITTGFTNELYEVDDYILKVCVRKNFEDKFNNEVSLYKRLQDKTMVPEVLVADSSKSLIDKPYMIYKKIPGESLGKRWHELNDEQRKAIIKELCRQLKLISKLEPNPRLESRRTWQDQVVTSLGKDLAIVAEKKLLPETTQNQISDFIKANKHALEKQNLAFLYWDVHLDNIIVDEQGKMVGLIDFEHTSVVSIDFLLDIVRQMVRYPWLMLSQEMEKHADKKDYDQVMDWYKEFFPELFDFPELETRLDLYEIEGILRKLPSFPKATQLHNRLQQILGT